MAISSLFSQPVIQIRALTFTCNNPTSPRPTTTTTTDGHKRQLCLTRRVGTMAVMTSILLTAEATIRAKRASGFEFRMTVPGQTVEEAENTIKDHAQALLDVKSLVETKLWREAQRELRKNAAFLKQDIYTIIQSKEGSIRPLLRKLYFRLFDNVSKLDYAARDQDPARVQECYDNVAAALDDILSRIYS